MIFALCCLIFSISSHIIFMRSLKRIKLNNLYDFTFLLKPLMLLSVVSALTYGLKLLGVAAADKIFFTVMIVALITVTLNRINNIYKKIILHFLPFLRNCSCKTIFRFLRYTGSRFTAVGTAKAPTAFLPYTRTAYFSLSILPQYTIIK